MSLFGVANIETKYTYMTCYSAFKALLAFLCLTIAEPISSMAQTQFESRPEGDARSGDTIYIVPWSDNFDTSEGSRETFGMKNIEERWSYTKQEIERKARERGANVALCKMWGNASRGYTIQVSLFAADSSRLAPLLKDTACHLIIFRDNGPSLAIYKYDITIEDETNEVTYKYFRDLAFLKKPIIDCQEDLLLTINKQERTIPIQGRSRYFRLINGGASRKAKKSELLHIGGYYLQEIRDAQLGNLLAESHEEHIIAPKPKRVR